MFYIMSYGDLLYYNNVYGVFDVYYKCCCVVWFYEVVVVVVVFVYNYVE